MSLLLPMLSCLTDVDRENKHPFSLHVHHFSMVWMVVVLLCRRTDAIDGGIGPIRCGIGIAVGAATGKSQIAIPIVPRRQQSNSNSKGTAAAKHSAEKQSDGKSNNKQQIHSSTCPDAPVKNCGFPGCTSTWQDVSTACLRTLLDGSCNSCSRMSLTCGTKF